MSSKKNFSSRHIARLAKKQAEHDIAQISFALNSASSLNSSQRIETIASSELEFVVDEIDSSETARIFDGTAKNDEHASGSSFYGSEEISVAEHCMDTNHSDAISLHENETNGDSDSESYRYSDSDAESIPGEDDIDTDFRVDSTYGFLNDNNIKNQKFRSSVHDWAIDFSIPHVALKSLLTILNEYTNVPFPKDPRTLLKTPKFSAPVVTMHSGSYCHLGLENCVKKIIETRLTTYPKSNKIKLLTNIDGAPIGHSSEKSIWPILVKDYYEKIVHVVGLYFGQKKPGDPNDYLRQFVDEARQLVTNNYTYKGKQYIVRIFVAVNA
uniref:Uncharacterized protein n=1 Tax=Trichogramma kaykai TaxID=54128 RepID=A0ABD2VT09_9HYME